MSEADRIFNRFPDFIREFIYRRGWDSLRDVQIAAARVIFDSEDNLLLTSSTASGKTEAAFFPILADLCADMPDSVAVLYIAPLKSLINDQFLRLDELLDMSGIPVFHWHGDVGASHKNRMLKEPRGILQITPESLESMLINRSNDLPRLFGSLRYVVIDELHTLIGADRGSQILCELSRLSAKTGRFPRRIGLSATIGDPAAAAAWLGAGSRRKTAVPSLPQTSIRWRLGMEHFFIQNPNRAPGADSGLLLEGEGTRILPAENAEAAKAPGENRTDGNRADENRADENRADGNRAEGEIRAAADAGYEYLYDCVYGRRALVFSNSREETEVVTATLRQIAEKRGDRDLFYIHHGNLSAALREEAELKMKSDEEPVVTCATVTMELGIDIGRLERVAQVSSPTSVSGFLQRLGRSGRRGDPPEMMMVFREEEPLPNAPLPQLIPWDLLRGIAVVQLYIEERFIEPPRTRRLPLSLLFQQTLALLSASGEMTARALAETVLALPPFAAVDREDYRTLLLSMVQNEYLEQTEEKGLIVGLKGEKLTNSFKFYAVFSDSEDYTVRCESDEIGTITTPPPVGDRFALAGRVWEVAELDPQRRLIYVKAVKGKMEISWPGDYGEIHTRILERMKQILCEDTVYPYLKPHARARLDKARQVARNTKMTQHSLVHLGGYSYCLFPWLGTRSFATLRRFLVKHAAPFGISAVEHEGCCYITFKMERGTPGELIRALEKDAREHGIDTAALIGQNECPVSDKYDELLPPSLLRRAFSLDHLRADEVIRRLGDMVAEDQNL